MLLPYTTLVWYGPCASAAAITALGNVKTAQPRGRIRASATLQGDGVIQFARPLRLVGRTATLTGSGAITAAQPRGRIRASATLKVNELSQDDVTGAVLEAQVEGGVSVKQALRLLLAHASGNATGLDGSAIAFKSVDGSKTRIGGTISGGSRTITTRDPT